MEEFFKNKEGSSAGADDADRQRGGQGNGCELRKRLDSGEQRGLSVKSLSIGGGRDKDVALLVECLPVFARPWV